jgi:hypothetical protein
MIWFSWFALSTTSLSYYTTKLFARIIRFRVVVNSRTQRCGNSSTARILMVLYVYQYIRREIMVSTAFLGMKYNTKTWHEFFGKRKGPRIHFKVIFPMCYSQFQLTFHRKIPNFVPNFANSLPSSKVHNEIHKQVCKQSLWLAIKSNQPIKFPVYKPVCMNFWTWQRICEVWNEVRNLTMKSQLKLTVKLRSCSNFVYKYSFWAAVSTFQ